MRLMTLLTLWNPVFEYRLDFPEFLSVWSQVSLERCTDFTLVHHLHLSCLNLRFALDNLRWCAIVVPSFRCWHARRLRLDDLVIWQLVWVDHLIRVVLYITSLSWRLLEALAICQSRSWCMSITGPCAIIEVNTFHISGAHACLSSLLLRPRPTWRWHWNFVHLRERASIDRCRLVHHPVSRNSMEALPCIVADALLRHGPRVNVLVARIVSFMTAYITRHVVEAGSDVCCTVEVVRTVQQCTLTDGVHISRDLAFSRLILCVMSINDFVSHSPLCRVLLSILIRVSMTGHIDTVVIGQELLTAVLGHH